MLPEGTIPHGVLLEIHVAERVSWNLPKMQEPAKNLLADRASVTYVFLKDFT
jgi:hypothetical protein